MSTKDVVLKLTGTKHDEKNLRHLESLTIDDTTFVFVNGESQAAQALRRLVRVMEHSNPRRDCRRIAS